MEDSRKVVESLQEEVIREKVFTEKEPTKLISEEEFRTQIHEAKAANYQKMVDEFKRGILRLRDYSGVSKFRSVRRAIRRGQISIFGDIYPKRPFKNIKAQKGSITYTKKRLHEQFTHKNRKVS